MSGFSPGRLGWYARRAARMSPAEVAWRARDQAAALAWSRRQVKPGQQATAVAAAGTGGSFTAVLPAGTAATVPAAAKMAVLAAADRLMRGEWEVLGVTRTDLVAPDWFRDPVTGRRSSPGRYAFRINQRSEEQVGNIKQVWEVSRLQHLTLLATAWFLTGDEAYAQRVAGQLRSWYRENPFLSGVHWTSGIEVGIRLISLVWIRRLMDGWPGVAGLFEADALALRQIRWHQQYLDGFRSRGSSANNHVIAEAAGQLAASCAFPWFPESGRWRRTSARLLERELLRNTFPSGIGRELASDYQCFVAELGILAAVEAGAARCPLSAAAWQRLCAMTDSAAALVDAQHAAATSGDGDDGRAVLLDAPVPGGGWPSLLALGDAIFGRLGWWPPVTAGAASTIVGGLAGPPRDIPGRPAQRPSRFADAGVTLLRTDGTQAPEIWCRLDGGPHGFLSIAAHAHADALSVEVRYGGVDVLADPGTYCYHGEPAWRSYFRSTIAHNTLRARRAEPVRRRRPLPMAAARQRPRNRRRGHGGGRRVDRGPRRLPVTAAAGPAPPLGPAGPCGAQYQHHRPDRRRRVRRPARLPPRPRRSGGARRQPRGPALASRGHAGGGAAGAAAAAAVEPAPRRNRSDPRLVLTRSRAASARVHASRPGSCAPAAAFTTRLRFLDAGKSEKTGLYPVRRISSGRPPLYWERRRPRTRRPDERAGAGPEKVRADRPAASGSS